MKRHIDYQRMVACQGSLEVADSIRLTKHLERCARCRDRRESYARQSMLLRNGACAMPPPGIRRTVLAALDGADVSQHTHRLFWQRRRAIGAAVLATVLVLGGLETPLPRVVAETLGYPGAEPQAISGHACQDGVALLRYAKLLQSPSAYDPGPHGAYHGATGTAEAARLIHPIWYVMRDDGGGISAGACESGVATADTEIGFNPDNGTQLHVFGRLKDSQQP